MIDYLMFGDSDDNQGRAYWPPPPGPDPNPKLNALTHGPGQTGKLYPVRVSLDSWDIGNGDEDDDSPPGFWEWQQRYEVSLVRMRANTMQRVDDDDDVPDLVPGDPPAPAGNHWHDWDWARVD